MKLSFIVYQLKFYIEMPFCPTPMDMFLVAVCYNKYDLLWLFSIVFSLLEMWSISSNRWVSEGVQT